MPRAKLMLIIFGCSVVLCGGYALYLVFGVGLGQGAWPQFLGLIAAILAVGGITWYVRKNE